MYIEQNLRKALSDRIYEKRKPAALQLEQNVRRAVEQGDTELLEGVIAELSRDFAYALRHPNYRNGGLIGLAAVAIALGQEGLPAYLDDIMQPILACFGDADARVRYYACESLYNVAKIAKGEILAYFNEIFDALCKLTADVEESVRNGANLVDQLLRDIVVETATTYLFAISRDPPAVPPAVEQPEGPEGPTLQRTRHSDGDSANNKINDNTNVNNEAEVADVDVNSKANDSLQPQQPVVGGFALDRFIPLLVERIYVLNPATRMFLVQWIMLLDSIPDLELVKYVPEFLEGLLLFLTDTHKDVRVFTKSCLDNLLKEISDVARLHSLGNSTVLSNAPNTTNTEHTAITTTTTTDSGKNTPVSSGGGIDADLYRIGQDTFIYYSQIVDILLGKMDPSHVETQLVVLDWIEGILQVSPQDVLAKLSVLVPALLPALSDEIADLRKAARRLSDRLVRMLADHSDVVDAAAAAHALARQLDNDDKVTRLASLQWLAALYSAKGRAAINPGAANDDLFIRLLNPLSDASDEVAAQALELLALILRDADSTEFSAFVCRLVDSFRSNEKLFAHRGKSVCLHLCIALTPERVFRAFAAAVSAETAPNEKGEDGFDSLLIQNLTNILLTAPELHRFRLLLTQLHTPEGVDLFTTLFSSWKCNSVATLSLCLLAQAYRHAFDVLETISRCNITVSTLIRIDKLVQLIEGPVFAQLRMHLLQPQRYHYLYKTLYGMLMVLPQSKAFTTLHTRLSSVSAIAQLPPPLDDSSATPPAPSSSQVDWKRLLTEFREVYQPSNGP